MNERSFWVLVAIILCLVVYFNASCPDRHQNSIELVPSLLKENLGSVLVPARNKPIACYF
jgi:hypothetical protein